MTFKVSGLRELQQSFRTAAKAVPAAEARAVKRVGVSIKAAQSREIAGTLNLRASTIKAELVVKQQPTAQAPRVVFEVRARGVPLKEFIGTVQTSKGVRVRMKKKQPAHVLRAAFGVDKQGGHFFGRAAVGSSSRYGSPHVGRTPIVKLYGPNVLSQFLAESVQSVGMSTWQTRIPIELDREIAFALRRVGL